MADAPDSTTLLRALVQRFAEAKACWFTSVRPDGRAHSVPIWHVWREGRVYVVTHPKSVKVANIRAHPDVVVTHPDASDTVIIEGTAAERPDLRETLGPLFRAKYDWYIEKDPEWDTIIEVTPTKLMAWGQYGSGRWKGAEIAAVSL
jgi:general stress protein 26